MNDTFNFQRFGKYLAGDLKSCISNYGLSALLISLMGIIIYAGTILMGLIFDQTWEGPSIGFRVSAFIISMCVLIITMPPKCYGHITDRKAGSAWLLLPASRAEKYVAMLLMCIVVVPAASATVYLGIDALLCAVDSTCGQSILSAAAGFSVNISDFKVSLTNEIIVDGVQIVGEGSAVNRFVDQITCPWLYVDDYIMSVLIFVLGAVAFRKGKTVKTFIFLAVLNTVLSVAASPLLMNFSTEMISNAPESLSGMLDSWLFRNVALCDTINDTVFNVALLLALWFRLKTMKH